MPMFDPSMLQGLAQQLAARGGGQGGGVPGAGAPEGGMPAGNTGVVPPWLAQIRGGNPFGGMLGGGGAAQGGGGWNPLAALQARFGGQVGQGAGGFQLPPWLAAMRGQGGQGGTPIVPQGGGQGAGMQVPQGGGMSAGLWNPASWGAGNPNAQAIAQRVMPVAGASPQAANAAAYQQNQAGNTQATGNAAQAAALQNANSAYTQNRSAGQAQPSAWNPSSWGAGKPDAQALMHQNMATDGGEPGVVQGAKQPTVAGASQRVRRSY